MIYNLPHYKKFFWPAPSKVQWETVHLPPQRKDGNGGFVYLSLDWLEFIRAMNSPEAFQWMCAETASIIWGIRDKKNLGSSLNAKARMPLIAIAGNQIWGVDERRGFAQVIGMAEIDYSVTPEQYPYFWHRIWCITKIRKGVSEPHDTPRGPAYLPILNVAHFLTSKSLSGGKVYIKVK